MLTTPGGGIVLTPFTAGIHADHQSCPIPPQYTPEVPAHDIHRYLQGRYLLLKETIINIDEVGMV